MNPNLKKYLPMILVGIGVLIVVIVSILILKSRNKGVEEIEEESVPELSEEQWPAVSLTPTEDPAVPNSLGHFLKLRVEKINIADAKTMDYLLVYSTSDGGQQGVPGSVTLAGDNLEKMLLLGSESNKKFRFDAGVTSGNITITFRNSEKKTIGKLSTDFSLQSEVAELTSMDGMFKYTLSKPAKGVFFVTMKTFKEPTVPMVIWQNGYGVFASDGKDHAGTVN
jgi:hypothetical protein